MLLAVQLAAELKTLATLGTVACNMFALHCDAGYGKLRLFEHHVDDAEEPEGQGCS